MKNTTATYRRPPGLPGVELLHLADPDFRFAPHVHDAYVFWFNGHGAERVSINGIGGSDILQPDSFGVVAPGETHANHAVTDERSLQSLYVDEAVITDVATQTGTSVHHAAFRSRLQRDPQSRAALCRLHTILMHSADTFLQREAFLDTFTHLLHRHGEAATPPRLPAALDKVRHAESVMHERYGQPLDVDELAAHCGCTACHLIRLFRRHRGMTPHAFLMDLRLRRAKSFIALGTAIADAAIDTGFTDQSHLTRRFAVRFGITPGAYRKQIRS